MPVHEPAVATLDRLGRSSALVARLETTRADMHAFRRRRLLLTTILTVLVGAGLLAAADWLLVLGTTVRAVGLLAIGGVAMALVVRGFLRGRSFGRPDAAVSLQKYRRLHTSEKA